MRNMSAIRKIFHNYYIVPNNMIVELINYHFLDS